MTSTAVSTTKSITVPGLGPVELTLEERGDGQPFLVLHGGAGPQSVATFAGLLVEKDHNHVLMPTHPGFGGTPRPDELNSVAKLAILYRDLLDDLHSAGVQFKDLVTTERSLEDIFVGLVSTRK